MGIRQTTMRGSRSVSRASSSSTDYESESAVSVSPTFDTLAHQFYPARKPYRMASSFELSSEQPRHYLTRARRLAASSYQNLFGEPAERARPLSKKVIKIEKPEPKQKKPKPLPVDPLSGQILGRRELRHRDLSVPAAVKTKRSPGGNHTQLW